MSGLDDPTALVGRWRFHRMVVDRLEGVEHRVDGVLELSAQSADHLTWEERGHWHQPSGEVEVSRSLLLDHQPERGWWVRFEDGREFHRWAPGQAVLHDCRPDTYRGTVTGSVKGWTVVWEVSGPRKDYTMTTQLTPVDPGP